MSTRRRYSRPSSEEEEEVVLTSSSSLGDSPMAMEDGAGTPASHSRSDNIPDISPYRCIVIWPVLFTTKRPTTTSAARKILRPNFQITAEIF